MAFRRLSSRSGARWCADSAEIATANDLGSNETVWSGRSVFRFERLRRALNRRSRAPRYPHARPPPPLSSGDAVSAGVPGVPDEALPGMPRDAIRRDHGEAALGEGEGEGRGGRPAKKPSREEETDLAVDPPLEPAAVPVPRGAPAPRLAPHAEPPVELGVAGVAEPPSARDCRQRARPVDATDCGGGG